MISTLNVWQYDGFANQYKEERRKNIFERREAVSLFLDMLCKVGTSDTCVRVLGVQGMVKIKST